MAAMTLTIERVRAFEGTFDVATQINRGVEREAHARAAAVLTGKGVR